MFYLEHLQLTSRGLVFRDKMGRQLSISETFRKGFNRIFNYWLDAELFFLRLIGVLPIHTIRVFFYKLAGMKIGKGSHLHTGTDFYDPRGVRIGEGTIVGRNAFLDGRDELAIGDNVDIASDVMIYNSEHDLDSDDFSAILAPVEIGDFCFIGPRAIILPGVKIGKGAVVVAGAVVTKDVGEFVIVGGVPARPIGERKNKNPGYKLGRARLFQ